MKRLNVCQKKLDKYQDMSNTALTFSASYLIVGRAWLRSSTSSHDEIFMGHAMCPNVSRTNASHEENCGEHVSGFVDKVLLIVPLSLSRRSDRCRRPRRRGDKPVDVDGSIWPNVVCEEDVCKQMLVEGAGNMVTGTQYNGSLYWMLCRVKALGRGRRYSNKFN